MEEVLYIGDQDVLPPHAVARRALYAEPNMWSHPLVLYPFVHEAVSHPATPAPVLRNGTITLGSFATITKLSPETLLFWRAAMDAVPNATMLVKSQRLHRPDVLTHFCTRLNQAGLDLRRFRMVSHVTPEQHAAMFGEVDIFLDSFPYNGAQTTGEALAHGVPVVSLSGQMAYARMGRYLLRHAECLDLVADSPQQAISAVVKLAENPQQLSARRAQIKAAFARSPIFNAAQWMAETEAFLRHQWQERVASTTF
jgi:predicted O-linked N-acetylglucosamine transferase (SPINDLY family)